MSDLKKSFHQKPETQTELERELLNNSLAAAPGFFMVALWVAIKKFNSVENVKLISWIACALILLAVTRFFCASLTLKDLVPFRTAVRFLKGNIFINSILWGWVSVIPLVETHFQNAIENVGPIVMISALALSSMVSLSYNLWVAYFFQVCVIVPAIGYLSYLGLIEKNDSAFNVALLLLIVLIYMVGQTRNMHRLIVKRIEYALELKLTNGLLKESQTQLLEEKSKLQHSMRLAAVGEISGEIAHEINNPLGLMMGYIELAIEGLNKPEVNATEIESKLQKAKIAIVRITKIIKGLRHYARSSENEAFALVYVNEIIEDAIEFCSEKFNYHGVELYVDSTVEAKLNCREVEISQVLLNIFTNAIDEVTKMDKSKRKVYLATELKGSQIKISVSNSGDKISPDVQARLFEPFYSTKKTGIGTGLGLSISRNIIENHGGRLYFDDSNSLTTFIIELPAEV
ncbi:MAG: sensor histidine kinase [Pseudobdellovibrio sp.]